MNIIYIRHNESHRLGRIMREGITTTVVALPIVNEITHDGIITAMQLDQLVIAGLTYGAWFKIGMGVALVLLILERGLSVWGRFKRNSES
jgi:hypothetical protein